MADITWGRPPRAPEAAEAAAVLRACLVVVGCCLVGCLVGGLVGRLVPPAAAMARGGAAASRSFFTRLNHDA